ncbi:radical SAM protein [Brachyspira pulli]|uniref:radical SAM/SPASM domain-containing protein n=1 Tax=Brachyspira pulli TaxID=310721 RepID=UPI0030069AAA
MKDYVKIYNALDEKQARTEKERIEKLQANGLYPHSFDFPMTLQFELTSHCNVYCKHCYNYSGENNTSKDAMTPEKWIEFTKYIVKNGGIFECIISGGEPLLLGEDLFKIMDILHEDGVYFLLITNGFLLNSEKVKRLSKYRYHWLQVSIDGADAKTHDEFRRREGSWERAIDAAFMVSAAGIPLTIAHSVTPYNLKDVDKMCDLAYSLGASNIILGEINLSGRTSENKDLLLNREEHALLLQKYEENFNKYLGRMLIQRSLNTKYSINKYITRPNSGLIIRPNGDMRLDCMVPFVIGNVLKDDFVKIWKEKGISCWSDPKILEYASSFNDEDISTMITNYADKDILI